MAEEPTGAACVNRCKVRGAGGTKAPARCHGAHLLCTHCTERLEGWLESIAATWPTLRRVMAHGTVAPDPDGIRTATIDAPAPMRLEVVDALDTRATLGPTGVLTRWAVIVRGARRLRPLCSCLHSHKAHELRRHPTTDPRLEYRTTCTAGGCYCPAYRPATPTARSEAQLLAAHLGWITEQGWVRRFYEQVREVDRELRAVAGEYRPAPVGRCVLLSGPLPDQVECGGALMPRSWGGVYCTRCGDTWAPDDLRRLGLILEQPA